MLAGTALILTTTDLPGLSIWKRSTHCRRAQSFSCGRAMGNGSALVDPLGESTKAARRHGRRYRVNSLSDLAHDVSRLSVIELRVDLGDGSGAMAQDNASCFDAELLAEEGRSAVPQSIG